MLGHLSGNVTIQPKLSFMSAYEYRRTKDVCGLPQLPVFLVGYGLCMWKLCCISVKLLYIFLCQVQLDWVLCAFRMIQEGLPTCPRYWHWCSEFYDHHYAGVSLVLKIWDSSKLEFLKESQRQGWEHLLGCSIWRLLAKKVMLNQPWFHQTHRDFRDPSSIFFIFWR